MSLRINSFNGMNSQNQLRRTNNLLTKSLEKMASGRRINRASDDASGMVIADSLRSQAMGMGQAMRNANDAISMVQIADGALSQSSELLQNIRTKAIQASNGTQTTESRQAIQADIDKMVTALGDIANNTSYNGQKLLSGTFSDKSFQVGANTGETINISVPSTNPGQLGDAEKGQVTDINVLTEQGAQDAIAIVDAALADLNNVRSGLGSSQNQLSSTVENLAVTAINLQAAESQIGDVDFAEESMMLARMKILTEAQTFATTQTGKINQQQITSLLQG